MNNPSPFITGVDAKILSHLSAAEWQNSIDIAHWAELSYPYTAKCLKAMATKGMIEYKWDGDLGRAYWRLKQ